MADKICEWDSELGEQVERDANAYEQAMIDMDRATPIPIDIVNASIMAALAEIDMKSIRAIRDALSGGSVDRVLELEQEAIILRAQLKKE